MAREAGSRGSDPIEIGRPRDRVSGAAQTVGALLIRTKPYDIRSSHYDYQVEEAIQCADRTDSSILLGPTPTLTQHLPRADPTLISNGSARHRSEIELVGIQHSLDTPEFLDSRCLIGKRTFVGGIGVD